MKTALLFDLDGTLVDSDAEHLAAFQRVFAPHGVTLDRSEYAAYIMGAPNEMIASRYLAHLSLLEQAAILDAKEAAYRDALGELEPILGALALLDFADRRGLKRAVVTNAPRANAEKVLAALGIGPRLPIVVIGGELQRSKPDPLPYLTALERTGAVAAPFARLRRFSVGRSLRRRGGARRGGHDDHARSENSDRRGRDIRGQQFHRSADLRTDRSAPDLERGRRGISLRLAQFIDENGKRALGVTARGESRLVKGARTTLDLARQAIAEGVSLRKLIADRGVGKPVDLARALKEKRVLTPIDHKDPAHVIVTGTGLTHLGSAEGRDKMHKDLADPAKLTDSMRMFKLGLEGGKPGRGETGAQPEWFYKGDGSILARAGGRPAQSGFRARRRGGAGNRRDLPDR